MMNRETPFSVDYATARQRFRDTAARLGWQLEALPIDARGPDGEELTIDVAASATGDLARTLVVSSGVHGVEGFFGSAVQLALLEQWAETRPPAVKCLFLHGLNPYGFAWLRRFDEQNVDPNRNFLLPGEEYDGAPPGYAALDELLNPRSPPSRLDPFPLRALWAVARDGMSNLRQTIAAGQYEFPQGLFFGGAGPSQMHRLLADHLGRWLDGAQDVVHLDFHTGLGAMGTYKLLIDYPLSETQHARLTNCFGADSFEAMDSRGIAYTARGGFGQWCAGRHLAPEYLFACAEFGTYPPIRVLGGLRAENQAHHWGAADAAATAWAKERLRELFCPSDPRWRVEVIGKAHELVQRAVGALMGG